MRDGKKLTYSILAILAVIALVVIPVASGRLSIPGLRLAEDTPAPAPAPPPDIPFDQVDAGSATMANLAAESGTVHAALIAAPARIELVEGVETDVYAYNGRVPGPTLELREGDRVTVRFRNDLAEPT